MKLRNKETGEIKEAEARDDGIYLYSVETEQWFKYGLDVLAEYWEYYVEPKEPLIEFIDERNLVKHWADVYNVEEVWVSEVIGNRKFVQLHDVEEISLRININSYNEIKVGRSYTITELCGESEL